MSVAVGIALGAAASGGASVAAGGGAPAAWMAMMYVAMVPWGFVMFKAKKTETTQIASAVLFVVAVALVPIAIKLTS